MRFRGNVVLALLLLAATARGEAVVEIDSASAPPSPDLTSLPEPARRELAGAGLLETGLLLSGEDRPGALDLTLRFDPAVIEFVEAAVESATPDAMMEAGERKPGVLALSIVSVEGIAAGPLVRLRFRVLGGAESSALGGTAVAHDADSLAEIPVRVEPGRITVSKTEISKLSLESKLLILVFPAIAGVLLLIGGVRYARRLRGA
jgi:hypothetical protein